jgi:thiamine biosynthesis lipoprotein
MMPRYRTLLIIFLSCLALCLAACSRTQHELFSKQLFTFGTIVQITIISDKPANAEAALASIGHEFDRLNVLWNPWSNGELGQLNQHLSLQKPFAVSAELASLIKSSQQISLASQNLFNPAIGRLVKLWQFDQVENENHLFQLPDKAQINGLVKSSPDMSQISIDTNNKVSSSNSDIILDFGAFAKGAALDKMTLILKQHGIEQALVNTGGDLKVLGRKHNVPWRIGIKNPLSGTKAILAAVNLEPDEAIFTSGDYERFFDYDGQRYHHIIDPRTGYPANTIRSVTVLHKNAALADAAATALFIAGPHQWKQIARSMGVSAIMLLTSDNQLLMTPQMSVRIEVLTDIKPSIENL